MLAEASIRWKWKETRDALSKEAEHSLIDRTLQGSSDAFADLVGPHLPSLSRFVHSRLWSAFEAEDVILRSLLRVIS
jgi:hypothetical protein